MLVLWWCSDTESFRTRNWDSFMGRVQIRAGPGYLHGAIQVFEFFFRFWAVTARLSPKFFVRNNMYVWSNFSFVFFLFLFYVPFTISDPTFEREQRFNTAFFSQLCSNSDGQRPPDTQTVASRLLLFTYTVLSPVNSQNVPSHIACWDVETVAKIWAPNRFVSPEGSFISFS